MITQANTVPSAPSDNRTMAIIWTVVIAIASVMMVHIKGELVLADPDSQWHVAVGRLMWETGAMPRVDTMSHTYAGQPWIAKEWLSQAILFGVFALAGWPGLLVFSGLCLAACLALIAWRMFKGCPPFITLLILWVAINSLLGIVTARPHVIALPVVALFTIMLLDATERDQSPPWLALPVMTLWANLHAAFTLGFVIAAFLALDALLRAAPERRAKLLLLWAAFGAGLIAAACIHPYGAQSILINIDMARGNESVPLITEWNRHGILDATWFRIVIPAFLVATLAFAGRTNLARLGLGVFFVYLTWRHQRFLMMLAIVAPLITRDSVTAALHALAARLKLFQGLDPLRDPKWRLPATAGCLAGLMALPYLPDGYEPPGNSAPVAAFSATSAEIRALPVYNSYNFGGFLLLNRVPSFIDGRTDQLFTDNFMARLFAYMEAKDQKAFLAFIEGRGARWAIVQKGHKDAELMETAPGWRETYRDKNALVYVRTGG
jgi:hypothetical protein